MTSLEAKLVGRTSSQQPVRNIAKRAGGPKRNRILKSGVANSTTKTGPAEPVKAESTQVLSPARRITYLCLATVFFVLGVCGALLPLLPATPFFLLTSFFLAKSSPRLNAMLLRSKLIGPILVDWQMNGGVSNRVRFTAIAVVLAAVGITIYLAGYTLLPAVAVTLLASIGIGVILCLPTTKRAEEA